MQDHKILQGLAIPYSALISVVFGLMILSFPIGAYLFFNSQIGKSVDYALPITELDFLKGQDWLGWLGIGDVFIVAWAAFLILFVISSMGPKKNFLKVLSPIMSGSYESQDGSYLVQIIKWFSIIIVLSGLIDITQRLVGITITPPTFENDLTGFLGITTAPIIEEIGFRIILVGIPLFLLYSHRASARLFFKSLWNPSANLPITSPKKAIILVVLVGVMFGATHVLSDQWSNGKFAQAAMAGIIIGWVYYRYGFVAALLIHWATNYVVYSYAYLVSSINETRVMDSFSHSLILTIEVILLLTGALAIALSILEYRKNKMVKSLSV
ncbi:MAG: CPBP family intramembrane metalloprotease [Thaumarchaeota archaeon]|nr:CPBP family intramembrane metalloprotease [Nitrososphaerota archaeon]